MTARESASVRGTAYEEGVNERLKHQNLDFSRSGDEMPTWTLKPWICALCKTPISPQPGEHITAYAHFMANMLLWDQLPIAHSECLEKVELYKKPKKGSTAKSEFIVCCIPTEEMYNDRLLPLIAALKIPNFSVFKYPNAQFQRSDPTGWWKHTSTLVIAPWTIPTDVFITAVNHLLNIQLLELSPPSFVTVPESCLQKRRLTTASQHKPLIDNAPASVYLVDFSPFYRVNQSVVNCFALQACSFPSDFQVDMFTGQSGIDPEALYRHEDGHSANKDKGQRRRRQKQKNKKKQTGLKATQTRHKTATQTRRKTMPGQARTSQDKEARQRYCKKRLYKLWLRDPEECSRSTCTFRD